MTDMYSQHHEGSRGMQHRFDQGRHQPQQGSPMAHQIAKAATSATAGGTLLVLSGLTLAGTIIALILATPLLVIFSPVLVPAFITTFVLATGFLTSGGFGVAAATVLMWMYRYATDRHPTGADTLDDTAQKLGSKIREKSEHATGGGGHYGTTATGHYATGGGHVGYQT